MSTKKQRRQMNPALRLLLAQKKTTLAQVAEQIGKTPATVTFTLQGRYRNPETRKAIAGALGIRVQDLDKFAA